MALLGTSHIIDDLQAVAAAGGGALEAVLGEHADHLLGLPQRPHERHHDFDVVQPHVATDANERLATPSRKASPNESADVARRAAESPAWGFSSSGS